MQSLTSRSSTQAFMLRVLKVIINLRKQNFDKLINMKITSSSTNSRDRSRNGRTFNINIPSLHRSDTHLAAAANLDNVFQQAITSSFSHQGLRAMIQQHTSDMEMAEMRLRDLIEDDGLGAGIDDLNFDIEDIAGSPLDNSATHGIFSLGERDRRMMRDFVLHEMMDDGPPGRSYIFASQNHSSSTANRDQTQIQNMVHISNSQQPVEITSGWNPVDNSWQVSHTTGGHVYMTTKPKKDGKNKKTEKKECHETSLAEDLFELDQLRVVLSDCLEQFDKSGDSNAFLIVQSAVEAFFMVHSLDKSEVEFKKKKKEEEDKEKTENSDKVAETEKQQDGSGESTESSSKTVEKPSETPKTIEKPSERPDSGKNLVIDTSLPEETQKFLKFADNHRSVLNQILRQSNEKLQNGPFAVLCDHTRVLDFDIKCSYFRDKLNGMKTNNHYRHQDIAIKLKRQKLLEDSYKQLHRLKGEQWRNKIYIIFEGEEGQDAGGLLREWYLLLSKEMLNPNYCLFKTSASGGTHTINQYSNFNDRHLFYFEFIGKIVAKAIFDNKLLECYFTRALYKQILGKPVKPQDLEAEDPDHYKNLKFLLDNDVSYLGYDQPFTVEIDKFGKLEEVKLKENGDKLIVTNENKDEYVQLVCENKLITSIKPQLDTFLKGFYEIIPQNLISMFDEKELELLISGIADINIDDLRVNTEYYKYNATSLQVQWFWRALRSFDGPQKAMFMQFVTGTSHVPLQGFAYLEGMNGIQKFQIHKDERSTNRLPSAHTCFNQLDLPVYETYEKLRKMLLIAISEGAEGFGLA